MKISYKTKSIITISAISLAAMLSAPSRGLAEEISAPQLVLSATGYEVPENRVANDIAVITKEDIAHLPVHELSEALLYTTGLAIQKNSDPGSLTGAFIHGSDPRHVKVLVDGIPFNLLQDQIVDLSMLPVENVERIEVLKGSASSVWGSSLGGVINIVTRKPTEELSGEAGILVGEGNTRKYNASISGTAYGTGYFLSASRLETNNLIKNQDTDTQVNNIYLKLTREVTKGLNVSVSGGNNSNRRQYDFFKDTPFGFNFANRNSDIFGTVIIDYSPTSNLDISLSAFKRQFNYEQKRTYFDTTIPPFPSETREDSYGGTLRSVWRHSDKGTFSVGIDGSNWGYNDTTQPQKYYVDKKAAFLNENYLLGNLSLTAGIRYDDDSVFGSETSPSVGLAYNMEKAATIIRLNAARGFTPPPIGDRYAGIIPNPDLHAERAWTYQAGVETQYIPGLFGKLTFYRADITGAEAAIADVNDANSNGDTFETFTLINLDNLRRQGLELEIRTEEYKGLSLSYGYAFNDIKNPDTDEVVKDKPRETHDIGIDYRGPFETRTSIKGHYVNWNASTSSNAKDSNFIWDAKVSKYLAHWKKGVGEIFVAVHNITDENQYWHFIYPNPGRWVEAGVGVSF